MTAKELVTDEEIKAEFAGTNFGGHDHRKLLKQGVLKVIGGYASGSTLTGIMQNIGLISYKNRSLLKKGRDFLFESFYKREHSG